MFVYVRKNYLGKILRIQMLIYRTKPSPIFPLLQKGFEQSSWNLNAAIFRL